MNKVKFKLIGIFLDKGMSGCLIGFEIPFPALYQTYNDAVKCNGCIEACMVKNKIGNVVIQLYEQKELVEIIKWEEWWKYKCYRTKEGCEEKISLDGLHDFEPYSESFEIIFNDYVGEENNDMFMMEGLAYGIITERGCDETAY